MPKRKTITVAITLTHRKSRGYLYLSEIRKEFKKANKDITLTSDKKLQSILCQNKSKLLPNIEPRVYQ